jgi:transcriptional regulator with XRE-family HTH domain
MGKDARSKNSAPQTAEVRAANRLRQLRLDKGLTLTQLAKMAGLSQAFLSRVENHKLSIPISGLERVARCLEVSISAFFEEAKEAAPIVLCRKGQGLRKNFRGSQRMVLQLLAAFKSGKLMEPVLTEIPTFRNPVKPISHAGEEFDYLIRGEVDFLYGKQVIRLREGDSVYYDATVPHAVRAIKGRRGLLLVVVASKDYLFHGDITKLLKG